MIPKKMQNKQSLIGNHNVRNIYIAKFSSFILCYRSEHAKCIKNLSVHNKICTTAGNIFCNFQLILYLPKEQMVFHPTLIATILDYMRSEVSIAVLLGIKVS